MAEQERPIEVGDRFEDRDWRNAGRVVEVRYLMQSEAKVLVQVEVHPNTPSAVGRKVRISEYTLRTRYRRISR